MDTNILQVEKLKKYFPINKGFFKRKVGDVKAVDDITFNLRTGTTLAVVGESGSGKTTLAKSIMRFYELTEGNVQFDGRDISSIGDKELKKLKQQMQMVHQDPSTSLNPRKKLKIY